MEIWDRGQNKGGNKEERVSRRGVRIQVKGREGTEIREKGVEISE